MLSEFTKNTSLEKRKVGLKKELEDIQNLDLCMQVMIDTIENHAREINSNKIIFAKEEMDLFFNGEDNKELEMLSELLMSQVMELPSKNGILSVHFFQAIHYKKNKELRFVINEYVFDKYIKKDEENVN